MTEFPNHSLAVKEFTTARLNKECPDTPQLLSETAVRKYIGLCMSELVELARTVTNSNMEALEFTKQCLGMDPSKIEPIYTCDLDRIADQADAMVDLEYYSHDIANEHGLNLDLVFTEVHKANMLKKFDDGKFHTEEIAPGIYKVIKPAGWLALGVPDIKKVIQLCNTEGSWN